MIHPYFDLSGSDARGLLYGLLEVDKIQLRENPSLPSMRELVQTGKVRYRRADPEEHWQSYKEMAEQVQYGGTAYADCEDIATAIAAEDQVRYGVLSLPYAYAPREGLFHVVTAVPKDKYGSIPQHHWPGARFAPEVAGYVLQDPSSAAGMASFGGLPGKEVPAMSGYGAIGQEAYGRAEQPVRQRRRGLGNVFRSFSEGLLGGGGSVSDVARQLGTGTREGTGIKKGWATELGRSIPGRLGLPGVEAPGSTSKGEADTIASLRKGAAIEAGTEEGTVDEEFGDDDLDLSEDEEFGWFEDDLDEEMGFEPEDWTGSPAWHADTLGTRVADDMFGAVDDHVYTMGVFNRSLEGPISDAHDSVQARGRGRGFYNKMSHLERPAHMRKPTPSERPMATFGDLVGDEDFGAFWHKKGKRKEIVKGNLQKLQAKGKEGSKRWEQLMNRYEKLGGDEEDLEEEGEDFGYLSSADLFGDLFDDELEDLDLELEAEGF